MSGTYVAWNGREYPGPPPSGWEQRSDGRYWPVDNSGSAPAPTVGFAPQYGPSGNAVYALPDTLPPPSPSDWKGPRPLRKRSYLSIALGVLVAILMIQFVRLDVLGFTVTQQDFVNFDNPDDEPVNQQPLGEERELSPESIDRLLSIESCENLASGAALSGFVENDIGEDRTFLINIEFFIDGERQLDGFAEVTVDPNDSAFFMAQSASPAQQGEVSCAFGDVFRFVE